MLTPSLQPKEKEMKNEEALEVILDEIHDNQIALQALKSRIYSHLNSEELEERVQAFMTQSNL